MRLVEYLTGCSCNSVQCYYSQHVLAIYKEKLITDTILESMYVLSYEFCSEVGMNGVLELLFAGHRRVNVYI